MDVGLRVGGVTDALPFSDCDVVVIRDARNCQWRLGGIAWARFSRGKRSPGTFQRVTHALAGLAVDATPRAPPLALIMDAMLLAHCGGHGGQEPAPRRPLTFTPIVGPLHNTGNRPITDCVGFGGHYNPVTVGLARAMPGRKRR